MTEEIIPTWIWRLRWLAPLLLGIVSSLFIWGGWESRQMARVNDWPETQGIVSSIELRKNPDPEDREAYRPLIKYTYMVDGTDYTGSRFDFSVNGESILPADRESIIKSFAQGTRVTVYYDPAKPEESVLHRYDSTGADGTIAVGLVSMLCTIAVVIVYARAKRPTALAMTESTTMDAKNEGIS